MFTRVSLSTSTKTWWACLDKRHRRVRIARADDDGIEQLTIFDAWRFAGRYAVARWSERSDHYGTGTNGFQRFDLATGHARAVQLGTSSGGDQPTTSVAGLAVGRKGHVLAVLNDRGSTDSRLVLYDRGMHSRVLDRARMIANLRLTTSAASWTHDGASRHGRL